MKDAVGEKIGSPENGAHSLIWTVTEGGAAEDGARVCDLYVKKVTAKKKAYDPETAAKFADEISGYVFMRCSVTEETNWDWGITKTHRGEEIAEEITLDDIVVEDGRIIGAVPRFVSDSTGLAWGKPGTVRTYYTESISGTARSINTSDGYVEVKIAEKGATEK